MVAPDPDEKISRHELARAANVAAAAFRQGGWRWTGGQHGHDPYEPAAADIALALVRMMRDVADSTDEYSAIHSGRLRVERVIDMEDERVTTSILLELGESAEPLPEGVTPLPYPEPQLTDDDCAVVFDVEDLRHLVTMAGASGGWNEFEDDALAKARSMLADIDARSGAHAPDTVDDTTTELDTDTVWSYRMVNRGQYALTRDGSDVAEILFHERIPGTAAVVPTAAQALAKANHGRFVDPRNTPRSQR